MKVHHLNCGTMHPRGVPDGLVCHVLLLESAGGLVLVDSGYGLLDVAQKRKRVGPATLVTRPVFDAAETAARQVEALGHDTADVRHIVLTHFDGDHVGGIADFPTARVHLTAAEALGVLSHPTLLERERYRAAERAHGPTLVEHDIARGEAWRGFPAAVQLDEIDPGIVLVGLAGHTRGHTAVAVDAGDRWVLHVGDAFYHRDQLARGARAPRALTLMERSFAHDWKRVKANHERLAGLWAAPEEDLLLVNAHDPALLAKAQAPRPA